MPAHFYRVERHLPVRGELQIVAVLPDEERAQVLAGALEARDSVAHCTTRISADDLLALTNALLLNADLAATAARRPDPHA